MSMARTPPSGSRPERPFQQASRKADRRGRPFSTGRRFRMMPAPAGVQQLGESAFQIRRNGVRPEGRH